MVIKSIIKVIAILTFPFLSLPVFAKKDPCTFSLEQQTRYPQRIAIAKAACDEHKAWHEPFINMAGRVGWVDGKIPMEAEGETDKLVGDDYPWRRVATYWRSTPALQMLVRKGIDGANDCVDESKLAAWPSESSCRAFIVSNAWSAAFISYIAQRSRLRNFKYSHSHFDYIRDAYKSGPDKPYNLVDVTSARPEVGDLLCYSRNKDFRTYRSLIGLIDRGETELDTHCDVVVAANPSEDGKLYVIGGNVVQTVVMRKLALNAAGFFSPQSPEARGPCRIYAEDDCSLSRKNWVALLKMRAE